MYRTQDVYRTQDWEGDLPSFTLKWDAKGIAAWRDERVAKALARALKKSGNRAIRALRAEAKRQVRQRSPIKAKYLADTALPLTMPSGSAIPDLVWTMRVSGAAVPLGQFPKRQTKKGVVVTVSRGKSVLIPHAFLALAKRSMKGDSNPIGVFLRPGKARYPMGHRVGPRVSDLMNSKEIILAIQKRTQEVFSKEFKRIWPLERDGALGG